ncbi:MAG: efflux RND transporter permease subunit [Opitutales bacterium]
MNLSAPFVKRPVLTILLSVAAVAFGVFSYLQLPVSDLPDVEYPVLQVRANYPGANPIVMAQNVASPLEKQFLTIRGIDSVTSTNRQGNSTITLNFNLDRSVDLAAPDVQAAINAATGQLPDDLPNPPTYEKTNPNQDPILYIGLVSNSMTEGDLYDYAFNQIAQQINTVQGVSAVQVYGSPRAVRIRVDPQKLYQRGMTIEDIDEAVRRETALVSAGEVKGEALRLTIVPDTQLEDAEGYADIIVAYRDGNPIRLGDIADVVDSVENEDRNLSYNSPQVPEGSVGVVLAVNKAIGANAVAVANDINDLLPQLQEQIPDSIFMRVIYSRAETVIQAIDDVKITLVLAFVLVVAVIFLFLGRLTDTLVPIVVMPLSLLITFTAMRAFGFNLDNLTLMALTLSIGFLVDDAIVFLENTVRRMEDHGESPFEAALNGGKEISFTIVATSVTLIAVFLPVVFMPGLIGRIFNSFGMTIIFVVTASTTLALTLTPMMCGRFLRPHDSDNRTLIEKGAHAVEHFLLNLYKPLLRLNLKFWWASVPVWLLIGLGGFLVFRGIPQTFLPTGDSSFISGIFLTRTGASPQKVSELQGQIDEAIAGVPNVEQFVTVSGVGAFLQSNFIISFISLNKPGEREPEMDIQAVNGAIMGAAGGIPGVIPAVRPQPTLEISTTGPGGQQGEYAYSIYGINTDQVYEAAQAIEGAMFGKMGELFSNVQSDLFLDNPEVTVDVRRDAAARYGVGAVQFGRMLQQAYSTNFSYLIKADNQQYDVIVEVDDTFKADPEDLESIYLPTGDDLPVTSLTQNSLVPFGAIANYQPTTGPLAINHIDNFNSVTISFDLAEGATIGEATEFITGIAERVAPAGLTTEFRGQAEAFQESFRSFGFLMIAAGFAMFITLGILYESYAQPLTVMGALPVALAGGIFTLAIFDQQFSLYAVIGLFMLLGIVQKNGILLVDFALMRQEGGLKPFDAVYEASLERFRPIIMTTLSTVFGVLPIALGFGADGEARMPLGLAIVGGLIFAQIVTLFITPAFYLIFDWLQRNVFDKIPVLQRGERLK